MKYTLARALRKFLWGDIGQTKTIFNYASDPHSDSEVITFMSKVSRAPLRYIANIDFANPAVVNSTALNDLGVDLVWSRDSAGVYHGTGIGAFTGIVKEYKEFIPDIVSTTPGSKELSVVKISDDIIEVNTKLNGAAADGVYAGKTITVEVLRPITE